MADADPFVCQDDLPHHRLIDPPGGPTSKGSARAATSNALSQTPIGSYPRGAGAPTSVGPRTQPPLGGAKSHDEP